MIVMDLKIDNFFAFNNFHINMSYPKKIVDSLINPEHLQDRPNFRYKKVNIILGANATGKTSLGRILMSSFNFISRKEIVALTDCINDHSKEASISLDFIINENKLYRLLARILPEGDNLYNEDNVKIKVASVNINKRDNYEICAKKLDKLIESADYGYLEELDKVSFFGWFFIYANDEKFHQAPLSEEYFKILETVLKALDPSIKGIEKIEDVENSYIISIGNKKILVQDGEIVKKNIISSGTASGIAIANFLAEIIEGKYGFYYCDEKFSFVHSEVEKAILNIMISRLPQNQQLFFTTHNTDILDMNLPKHSFTFLKKYKVDDDYVIECVYPSDYLKRNTDSLKLAAENDLFLSSPDLDNLYTLLELKI